MQKIIEKYNIKHVWHFTDRSNIDSIKKYGLLSLDEIEKRKIIVSCYGGNDWSHDADKQNGMDHYVHLCFLAEHPMLYQAQQSGKITDPVWLGIDSSILLSDKVLFTNEVANKSGVKPFNASQAINNIDFEVLFERTDWKDPEIRERRNNAKKSEILVPVSVPLSVIKGIKK